MWVARAFFEVLSAERIDDGNWSGPVIAFTFMLYDNPGLRQLWSKKSLRRERVYKQLNQGAAFLRFGDQVRDNLAALQEMDE